MALCCRSLITYRRSIGMRIELRCWRERARGRVLDTRELRQMSNEQVLESEGEMYRRPSGGHGLSLTHEIKEGSAGSSTKQKSAE